MSSAAACPAGCAARDGLYAGFFADEPLSATFEALKDKEFGAVSLGCGIDEFLQTGMNIGDSCDVEISNGFRPEDVPVTMVIMRRRETP